MFDASQFIGPVGGLLALSYAAGWITAEKRVRGYIRKLETTNAADQAECNRRITLLEDRCQELEDRSYHGQERQLAQVRESSYRVIGLGEKP